MVLIIMSRPNRTKLIYHGANCLLTRRMNTIAEIRLANLRRLIREAGTAAELSRRLDNVPATYLSQIITGVLTPSGKPRGVGATLASKLEAAMHRPRGWMDQVHVEESEPHAIRDLQAAYHSVGPGPALAFKLYPFISWVQAGRWTEAPGPFAVQDAEDWLPCPVRCGPRTFVLQVQGASMEDKFYSGDLIFVDPDAQPTDKSFVVVRLGDGNESTFKQLIIEGHRRYLRAYNARWPEPIIEIDNSTILCGVVVFKGQIV